MWSSSNPNFSFSALGSPILPPEPVGDLVRQVQEMVTKERTFHIEDAAVEDAGDDMVDGVVDDVVV